jgi:hypothetical protein
VVVGVVAATATAAPRALHVMLLLLHVMHVRATWAALQHHHCAGALRVVAVNTGPAAVGSSGRLHWVWPSRRSRRLLAVAAASRGPALHHLLCCREGPPGVDTLWDRARTLRSSGVGPTWLAWLPCSSSRLCAVVCAGRAGGAVVTTWSGPMLASLACCSGSSSMLLLLGLLLLCCQRRHHLLLLLLHGHALGALQEGAHAVGPCHLRHTRHLPDLLHLQPCRDCHHAGPKSSPTDGYLQEHWSHTTWCLGQDHTRRQHLLRHDTCC